MNLPSRTVVAEIIYGFTGQNQDSDSVSGIAMIELIDQTPTGKILEVFFHSTPLQQKEEPEESFPDLEPFQQTLRKMISLSTPGIDSHIEAIGHFIEGATLYSFDFHYLIGALDLAFSKMEKPLQTADIVAQTQNLHHLVDDLAETPGAHESFIETLQDACSLFQIPVASNAIQTPLFRARLAQQVLEKISTLDFDPEVPLRKGAFPPLLNSLYYGNFPLARRLADKGASLSITAQRHDREFGVWECLVAFPYPVMEMKPRKESVIQNLVLCNLDDPGLSFLLDGETPRAEYLSFFIQKEDWGPMNPDLATALTDWVGKMARLMLERRTPESLAPMTEPRRL
jgi:hypothetical protein